MLFHVEKQQDIYQSLEFTQTTFGGKFLEVLINMKIKTVSKNDGKFHLMCSLIVQNFNRIIDEQQIY